MHAICAAFCFSFVGAEPFMRENRNIWLTFIGIIAVVTAKLLGLEYFALLGLLVVMLDLILSEHLR